jgi:hypothetical protein
MIGPFCQLDEPRRQVNVFPGAPLALFTRAEKNFHTPRHEWMSMAREEYAIFSRSLDALISVTFDPLI